MLSTGNFDDAQTGVKRVFADEDPRAGAGCQNENFPAQTPSTGAALYRRSFTIFTAMRAACGAGGYRTGRARQLLCATGNFGDILAGYYAKRMGLPVES